MTTPDSQPSGSTSKLAVLLLTVFAAGVVLYLTARSKPSQDSAETTPTSRVTTFVNKSQTDVAAPKTLSVWWHGIPDDVQQTAQTTGVEPGSNIHASDYVGPEACRECHTKNYDSWSQHPHRWMNALASEATVKGDFSEATIEYLDGKAVFYREDDQYRMRLTRGVTRTYEIRQTIGSRFFQYYIGVQISGPEKSTADTYHKNHVLPFGYWLDPQEWVPVVHIFGEYPDGERLDPFDGSSYVENLSVYSDGCKECHTTIPLGDLLATNNKTVAREVPVKLHWSSTEYLHQERKTLLPESVEEIPDYREFLRDLGTAEATAFGATLGVSCEACHLGSREHAENPKKLPKFFPTSPHLLVESDGQVELGRNHRNVNWACGRCHTGARPQFAAGMATWNSTEYSDAMRGSCYSELRCIDCHNPHEGIGKQWTHSAASDDARCVKCHEQFNKPANLTAHTHHPADSAGSRCMNCHMPRINEGMQDVVRTHMIYSPTEPRMIEANHLNACNLCHTDQPIDWTLEHLSSWYGAEYDEQQVARAYPKRDQPVGLGWLESPHEAVRLVGSDALTRTRSKWALPQIIKMLDDPFLLNRQFTRVGIEEMLEIKLEDYGYRFYMTPEERREPIEKLLTELTEQQ